MTRGVHRVTSGSKRGRQVAALTGRIERGVGLTPEQKAWNDAVEARRKAKQDRKAGRCPSDAAEEQDAAADYKGGKHG
ncbi:hypothetical protein UFOVP1040_39 [uncultured Caudovirales phage]|uniref:Uncharacterized protein n=1 Tax=uncultured Caudovirales phage TaxID=2100421 RepID=A0A6J5QGT5_9CAUD|nr:hypothetical protein UFOVP1040_39 [uncultured Caudovirales phage]